MKMTAIQSMFVVICFLGTALAAEHNHYVVVFNIAIVIALIFAFITARKL